MNLLHNFSGYYVVSLSPLGWIAAAIWLSALFFWGFRIRHQHPRWQRHHLFIFILLLILTPLLSSITIPAPSQEFPLPAAIAHATLMLIPLAALGWGAAAGFLGTPAAMLFGFFTGALLAFRYTHLPFQPLAEATLAGIFGWAIWQPYSARSYRALRQPFIAAIVVVALSPIPISIGLMSLATEGLGQRLDLAIALTPRLIIYQAAALLLMGIITQTIAFWHPLPWGYDGELEPSPFERSLTSQFSFVLTVIMVIVALSILVGNWMLAERSARASILERLQSTADIAARSIPFFTESGDLIIQNLASAPQLASSNEAALQDYLAQAKTQSFFFDALLLADAEGHTLTSYPKGEHLFEEEIDAIHFLKAANKARAYHTTAHSAAQGSTLVSFAAPVAPADGEERHLFLIGRTTIRSNPYSQPITEGLDALTHIEGGAVILDARQHVLFATDSALGWVSHTSLGTDTTPQDATSNRYLIASSDATGTTWRVVTISPTSRLQSIALQSALPLTLIVIVVAVIGILIARSLLKVVTRSLRTLNAAAERIASGDLNQRLNIDSADEVGQLGRTFEYMRIRLRQRMDELSRLLHTSQRVAATLNVGEAADAVLRAVLSGEATAARVVLSPEALPDDHTEDYPTAFGRGREAARYQTLDQQILAWARRQPIIRLQRLTPKTGLRLPPQTTPPQALFAVALQYEQRFLGVLYVLYHQPHAFTDEEVRYLNALGLQMAMAAYTARLYFMAEVRRQRLLAVLDASPDPVLVTDKQGRLILTNRAATIQLPVSPMINHPLEESTTHSGLITLLRKEHETPFSEEITINNKVYFATVAGVHLDDAEIGRVCILRDVTHFKELDALKSEFVATVSHDLRAPLTLMNGYLTMLSMVGSLNERQQRYIAHIQDGVTNMTRLVNNLLDLGRIEAGVGLRVQLVPILDIVEGVAKRHKPLAQQKNITLEVDIAENTPPVVEADSVLLEQVLDNLVENAIKYTPAGGQVTILARPQGDDKILLGVKDTGVGISTIDQPRLFEKFFRITRRDAPKEKGTGLGLAIVKSIVERHHGRVWVDSQLGKGSTFWVELPLRQPQETKPKAPKG